ncbi:MAG: prepilin-type N-terminal cleavage/methylation domain-containing protein [Lachnospiraceae bacterium]|nr:prepilin-type N-terminal cleavage/methylation domain-containing protein [Lachnospiraceae bacterium]
MSGKTKGKTEFAGYGEKQKICRDGQKGFTLVELIVVLVILAILAGIAVPALLGYIDHSKEKKTIQNGQLAYQAATTLTSDQFDQERLSITSEDIIDLAGISGTVIKFASDNLSGSKFSYQDANGMIASRRPTDGVWYIDNGTETAPPENPGTGSTDPTEPPISGSESGTEENGTEESGTEENGTEESGTEESATEESSTEESATEDNEDITNNDWIVIGEHTIKINSKLQDILTSPNKKISVGAVLSENGKFYLCYAQEGIKTEKTTTLKELLQQNKDLVELNSTTTKILTAEKLEGSIAAGSMCYYEKKYYVATKEMNGKQPPQGSWVRINQ